MARHAVARLVAFLTAVTLVMYSSPIQGQAREGAAQGEIAAAQRVLVLPVSGTTSAGGTFRGTLSVQHFASGNGMGADVVAGGVLAGTIFDGTGAPVGSVSERVKVPVRLSQVGTATTAGAIVAQEESCGILRLEFGGIDLDVLGLIVSTGPISIDLSGESGGTNVLGTLVCQILALLTSVANLIGLLNQLLGLLGGLGAPATA